MKKEFEYSLTDYSLTDFCSARKHTSMTDDGATKQWRRCDETMASLVVAMTPTRDVVNFVPVDMLKTLEESTGFGLNRG